VSLWQSSYDNQNILAVQASGVTKFLKYPQQIWSHFPVPFAFDQIHFFQERGQALPLTIKFIQTKKLSRFVKKKISNDLAYF